MIPKFRLFLATLTVLVLSIAPSHAAKPKQALSNPDLTKGEKISAEAKHDWNLGATGARGWMFSNKLETSEARQIAITKVTKGSPADGALHVGDVVLGLSGKPFAYDPRVEFGKALTAAEAGNGNLSLLVWRGGKTEEVSIKLPVLGSYSATAPYDCPKSAKILELGCKALAARMQTPDYAKSQNAITRSLNAMALLASGNPEYLPLVRREAEWANGFSSDGFQTWWNAYVIMLLAEYKLATGDDAFTSGMNRLALEAAKGQSMVGSWGHKFAAPHGRLHGYGMMNAPGVPLTTSLIMARMAGLKDPAVDLAIDRSAKLLRFYIGKGAVPYGDHAPWTQTHEDNGKCGMAGVMFNLLGEKDGAEFFSRMSTASHGPERDCGHTGNFTNITWSMPGVNLAGPQATGAWMNEFGAWYYDLARTSDFRFPHQGPPDAGGDHFRGWDSTGAGLLAYAMPLKKILLTGKNGHLAPQIDKATAQSLINDGRGWSNRNRNSAYDALTPDELLERLGSWSPTVRERAAMALSRRKDNKPVAALVALLDSPSLDARYGACEALKLLKTDAAPAMDKLIALLNHEDLWLRIQAAETLGGIGEPAMKSLPILMERLTCGPTGSDPRGMEQRYLCSVVFSTMLKNKIDGVDRDLLRKAVAAGLQNEDGRARGAIGGIYQKLSFEEIKPILPAIHESIITPAPSGEMFADGIRMAGLGLLAKHKIREGLPLCLDLLDLERWGKRGRIDACFTHLATYGGAAKPLLPRMREIEQQLLRHPEAKGLQEPIDTLRGLIKDIEATTDVPELIDMPR